MIYPWAGWNGGNTPRRSEHTPVEIVGDDLWIGEKFQPNLDIAGSPRNSFRASLYLKIAGGRALNGLGAFTGYRILSNFEYQSIIYRESDSVR